MQYNYFPGRLRFRDPILRDGDIRAAALEAVKLICPLAQVSYKDSTASILAVYPPDSLDLGRLKGLLPYLRRLEPKVRFYTPKKKDDILAGIAAIRSAIERLPAEPVC